MVASGDSKAFDDPGIFVEIPLVNQIRPRVLAWPEAGWPGMRSITKRLIEHWTEPEDFEAHRFWSPRRKGTITRSSALCRPGGGLMDKLRQGRVLVRNWHALSWDSEERSLGL